MRSAATSSNAETTIGPGAPVLAFDVGGTDTKAALVDAEGILRDFMQIATPPPGPDVANRLISRLLSTSKQLTARNLDIIPRAVGLLVPGEVDTVKGIAIQAENMGWHNVPIRDLLAHELSLPVAFGHDVTGAGSAEKRLGAASAFEDAVFVSIGTGISCAIFIQGEPYVGSGMAGELGHLRVASEPTCRCGSFGCIEALSSAAAIVRRYNDLSGANLRGAEQVLQRVRNDDEQATAVWESALDALALGLSYITSLFAPEAIIIGGGLSAAGDDLFDPLRIRLNSLLTFQARPRLIPATLGGKAGVVGAAMLARDMQSV